MLLAQREELQQQYEQLSRQTRQAVLQWGDRQQVGMHKTFATAAI